jgi:Holliday junction resolvase-like predicted endonuclease
MRPIYEQESDREAQAHVASILERRWNCKAAPLPRNYTVDCVLHRGESKAVIALVEIKCRTNSSQAYPTYILSASKLDRMKSLSATMSVPALLVVKWTDIIGFISIRRLPKSLKFYIGGRDDRKDTQDKEPVIHIPISIFNKISLDNLK